MPSTTSTTRRAAASVALTPCPPELAFRFASGATARDLREFRDVVAAADAGLVEHHRSHYHHWARDVLAEPALADELMDAGDRGELHGEAYRAHLLDVLDSRVRSLTPKAPAARKSGKKESSAGAKPKKAARKR